MGEGRPKTVYLVVMPAIVAFATTHSRKRKPAHDGGGAPHRLCHCNHDDDSRSDFFGSNRTMSTSTPPRWPSRYERTASPGGVEGTENKWMSLSPSAADRSKLPRAMQNPLPTTTISYHWTHFVPSPLIGAAGARETTSSDCIELLHSFLCFHLASYFNRLCS